MTLEKLRPKALLWVFLLVSFELRLSVWLWTVW